jgi:hypothetical protein
MAIGDGGWARLIRPGVVSSDRFAAVLARGRIDAAAAKGTTRWGALGVQDRELGAVGSPARHELSHRKDGRHDACRGRVPRTIMAPPQQGQRSGAYDGVA